MDLVCWVDLLHTIFTSICNLDLCLCMFIIVFIAYFPVISFRQRLVSYTYIGVVIRNIRLRLRLSFVWTSTIAL
jgi:hypothetical protein